MLTSIFENKRISRLRMSAIVTQIAPASNPRNSHCHSISINWCAHAFWLWTKACSKIHYTQAEAAHCSRTGVANQRGSARVLWMARQHYKYTDTPMSLRERERDWLYALKFLYPVLYHPISMCTLWRHQLLISIQMQI